MKIIYGLMVFFIAVVASPAMADNSCYSPTELQAEELLRLHSELMVITVTCHQGSHGENLVPAYTGFTKRNIDRLHEAEQTMVRYYKANYGGDGVTRLDQLRTRLGNEYGLQIADISAPAFCAERRDKVISYYHADSSQVEDEVERMAISEKSYTRPCDSAAGGTRIARKGQ